MGKIRSYGFTIGRLPVGEKNCITDVARVKVGHYTLDYPLNDKGDYACTGVTAILPHDGNLFKEKVAAATYVINGFGKTTGLVQVEELGEIEAPIILTNTFAVPAVTEGTLQYMLQKNEEIGDTVGTINIVVGECNDSYLNSIRALTIRPEHAIKAIQNATNDAAAEGAVGAGKGMVCFGYKGGIGASSRVIEKEGKRFTVGVLVNTNFGSKDDLPLQFSEMQDNRAVNKEDSGSIMIVLATDAPLNERQLKRLAKRCTIGLGRAGSHVNHGSGDIVIAFSTATKIIHKTNELIETRKLLNDYHPIMNELFLGAAEATEEAIYNSLAQGETTIGRNNRTVNQLNIDKKLK